MLSIIIPIYNSEEKIERCVLSVLKQTYSDFELILIDDGSKDRSLDICHNLAKQDNRIRVYSHQNHGVSYTRNKGIDLAKGEYIQFIDSDDYIDEKMCQTLVNTIEKSNSDLIVCGIEEIYLDHLHTVVPDVCGTVSVQKLSNEFPNIFKNSLLNGPVNKLYIKERIQSGFPEDMSLGEDLIFNLNYIRNCKSITFIQDCLYFYDIRENSLNRTYRQDSIEIAEFLYVESLKFIEEFHVGEIAKKHVSETFVKFLFYGMSDVYAKSSMNEKERKDCVKYWMRNQNVVQALKIVDMPQLKQKVAVFLYKHQLLYLFNLMMKIKECH